MTTTILPGTEVAVFAAAVRAALSDLPPDDLDELTEGLEADLTERAADSGDPDLGDPRAYAEELRAAAGFPPRSSRSHLGETLPNLRTLPQELRRRWDALLARRPLIASTVSFLVVLRPVWWVFRGAAAYALAASFLGLNGMRWWPIGVAFVVLSVQLGRGRMLGRAWVRWVLRVVSGIVIIASPFIAGWALDAWNNAMYPSYDEPYYPRGLTADGAQIDNIFAYDADGEPIDQVQLFDQNGNPLNVIPRGDTSANWWDAQDGSMLVPSGDVAGRAGWNVFPLAHVNDWTDYEDDGQLDVTELSPTTFPFDSVKPLAGHEPAVVVQDDPAAPPTTGTSTEALPGG